MKKSLLLKSFLYFHAAGSLTYLLGPKYFNAYANKLKPLKYVGEAVLSVLFLDHIEDGILKTILSHHIGLPWYQNKRFLSSIGLLYFLQSHLSSIRFNRNGSLVNRTKDDLTFNRKTHLMGLIALSIHTRDLKLAVIYLLAVGKAHIDQLIEQDSLENFGVHGEPSSFSK